MDKKLLDCLSNLSFALEEIANALNDKEEPKSATAKAIKSGDFISEITEINVGIKSLQLDTKQILTNQETIIKMGKDKSVNANTNNEEKGNKLNFFNKISDNKKGIIDSVGTIILIAGAVMAIGLAFSVVGNVDFKSVISLALALPLLAIGFGIIHSNLKKVGFDAKKDSVNILLAISTIALAITTSSWILSMITQLSFTKFATAVGIGLMFAAIAPSILTFIGVSKDMSMGQFAKSIIFLPMILPAIAMSITASSWILSGVTPIGITQFLTAIAISGIFVVLSYGITKMLGAFKEIGMKEVVAAVVFLPMILPAIAMSITASSWILSGVTPIGFTQFLTSILIAGVFVAISYGMKNLIGAFKDMKISDAIIASTLMPVVLVALSYSIALSSHAFSMVQPISFTQGLTTIFIAGIFVLLSYGLEKIIDPISKAKWSDVAKLPAFYLLISTAIMASSYILSAVKPISFAQGITTIFIAGIFTVLSLGIGKIIRPISKLNWTDVAKLPAFFLLISTAIMASSYILSATKIISISDMAHITLFGIGLSVITIVMGGTLFALQKMKLGIADIAKGSLSIVLIATTVMVSSHILALGNYKKFPSLDWSIGVAASILTFGLAAIGLGAIITASGGLGAGALAIGALAVLGVATTIVASSHILALGNYKNGPSLDWSKSVSLSLLAFGGGMVLLGTLITASFGVGALALAAGSGAVLMVSQTIVDSASILSKGKFVGGPTKAWAEGTSIALGAFAPVYKMLANNNILKIFGLGGVGPDDYVKAIKTVSLGIVTAASYFASPEANATYKNAPPKAWAEGIGAAIGAFAPIFSQLSKDSGWFISGKKVVGNMKNAVISVSEAIVGAAKNFWLNQKYFNINIDQDFVKKMGKNILDYTHLVKSLNIGSVSPFQRLMGIDPVQNVAKGMVMVAKCYDRLAKAVKNFSSSLNGIDPLRVNSFTRLTGNIALLSALDYKMFNNMMRVLDSQSGVFANMLQLQSGEFSKTPIMETNTKGSSNTQGRGNISTNSSNMSGSDKLDKILAVLVDMNIHNKNIDDILASGSNRKNFDLTNKN